MCTGRNRHVVDRVAILAVGEDLDDLRTLQSVGDCREVERVAAGHIATSERQRGDGVGEIVAGAVYVERREIDGDGHETPVGHVYPEARKAFRGEACAIGGVVETWKTGDGLTYCISRSLVRDVESKPSGLEA